MYDRKVVRYTPAISLSGNFFTARSWQKSLIGSSSFPQPELKQKFRSTTSTPNFDGTMADDKSELKSRDKKEKKEKKDKKRKHSEVAEPDVEIVAEKKKKDKKRKSTDATTGVLNALEADRPGAVAVDADGDVIVDADAGAEVAVVKDEDEDKEEVVKVEIPLAALVPFANPLCDDKSQKKVLKSVKKGMRTLSSYAKYHICITNVPHSRQEQNSQARRQRVRQSHPQIATFEPVYSLKFCA